MLSLFCCAALDGVVRMGRSLRDKAPQSDHEVLHDALVQLKTKWTSLCSRAVDRFVSLTVPLSLPACVSVFMSVFLYMSCALFLSAFLSCFGLFIANVHAFYVH